MTSNVLRFPSNAAYSTVPDGLITGAQLIAESGITYRQLDYWTRTGLLRTATEATPGSGSGRLYPSSEASFAAFANHLLDDLGMSLQTVREHGRTAFETGVLRLGAFTIISDWSA